MSARGRRGKKTTHAEEEHVDERWLVSYADMITVLMCLFLVLFAMSTVDAAKYELLKNSLATGFGATESDTVDTASGVVVPAAQVGEEGTSLTAEEAAAAGATPAESTPAADANLEAAKKEVASLEALKAQVAAGLDSQALANAVEMTVSERGLTIRLVGSEAFFETNSTALNPVAVKVLQTVNPVLTASAYSVAVEGHADPRAAMYPFPTNWELSAGRATQVLRFMVEQGGMPGTRISSVGFGSARSLSLGTTPEELVLNRRVDIVVLSSETEAVRALIPGIVAAE